MLLHEPNTALEFTIYIFILQKHTSIKLICTLFTLSPLFTFQIHLYLGVLVRHTCFKNLVIVLPLISTLPYAMFLYACESCQSHRICTFHIKLFTLHFFNRHQIILRQNVHSIGFVLFHPPHRM